MFQTRSGNGEGMVTDGLVMGYQKSKYAHITHLPKVLQSITSYKVCKTQNVMNTRNESVLNDSDVCR